jgi:quinol monooxygenase YgiN
MPRFLHTMLAAALAMLAVAPAARAQDDPTVFLVSYIDVAPASKGAAAGLLRQVRDASRKDDGLIRFEVLQRTVPSNQFVVLEIWKDQQALDAHAATAHAKHFREKLQPMLLAPIDDRFCVTTTVDPMQAARARATAGAVYVVTHVDVGPPNREKAVVALKALAEPSRKDAGNLRFDVVHQKNRTNHFTVIEVWKDQKSDDAHEHAAHTKEFRAVLTPLTGALYDQRWYKSL